MLVFSGVYDDRRVLQKLAKCLFWQDSCCFAATVLYFGTMSDRETIDAGAPEMTAIHPHVQPQSEGEIMRTEISMAMILAGVRALCECEDRKEPGLVVTDSDLVCAVYAAMRSRS